MNLVRHVDGTVHFSDAKKIDLSGAHYVTACKTKVVANRPMRIGTGTHFILLGDRPGSRVLQGPDVSSRSTKVWKDFASAAAERVEAECAGTQLTLLTKEEWEQCEQIAAAVLADPVVKREGYFAQDVRRELPLRWVDAGLDCSTSGVDLLGATWLAEFKTTTTTEPRLWMRQAERMRYHAQLAWYRRGARANGFDTSTGLYIIGAEVTAPFAVTVLELSEGTIEKGDRLVEGWLDRIRAGELTGDWPSYAQAPVMWDVPDYAPPDEDEEEDDDKDEGDEAAA